MRDRREAEPTVVARISRRPAPLTEPPDTSSPTALATGRDFAGQHGLVDLAAPATILPSTGMRSPGRDDDIAAAHRIDRRFRFDAILEDACDGRAQGRQRRHGVARGARVRAPRDTCRGARRR